MVRAAIVFACFLVSGCAASSTNGEAVDLARVTSGSCRDCSFEAVSLGGPAGLEVVSYRSFAVTSAREAERLQTFNVFSTWRRGIEDRRLLRAVFFQVGTKHEAAASELERYNRCAMNPGESGCGAGNPLPIQLSEKGTLLIVVSSRALSGYAGGYQSRLFRVPRTGLMGQAFGASVQADGEVFVEGDLVRAASAKTWTYKDLGFGYFVVSTARDWSVVAKEYRRVESEAINGGQASLSSIPRAPPASTDAQKLAAHWLWIRRNLVYKANPNVVQGGIAPSEIGALLKRGTGDCKDFTMLLRALLARDGVASESVLVDLVVAKDEPTTRVPSDRVDHVVLRIPSLSRVVDPTLAKRHPLPTGGRWTYPFAIDTQTGQVESLAIDQTQ